VRLELVEQEAEFRALEPEWWDLWARTPSATPFQSPAWLIPWWQAFHPGRLNVLAVWDAERLAGLAPFYIEGRRALPIGISLSDYLDVLIDPQRFDEAAPLLSEGIEECLASGLEEWEMPDLDAQAQAHALQPDAMIESHPAEISPVLRIPKRRRMAAIVPQPKLRKLRMARHRADRAGGYEIERCREPSFCEIFAALADMHAARWREHGVLADDRVCEFHLESLPRLDRAGLLRLLVCRIGGRLAGIYHGLAARRCAYAYLSGFDPAFAFFSPGTLLIGAAIEDAIEGGAEEFHFLRGNETYKYEWGAREQRNIRRVFRPALVRSLALR